MAKTDTKTLKREDLDEIRAKFIYSDERVKAFYIASRNFYEYSQYASMNPSNVNEEDVRRCFEELKAARKEVGSYLAEAKDGQQRLEREYIVGLAHMTGLDEIMGKVSKTPVEFQIEHVAKCLAQFPEN